MIVSRAFMVLFAFWSVQVTAEGFSYQAQVKGMVCAFCAYSVDRKISALPGVLTESVEVDLQNGDVVFRSTRPISEDSLESIFSESGFRLFDLRETAAPMAKEQRPSMLALDLKINGLDTPEFASMLEVVGNLAASRISRMVIHAPAASEPDLLKPLLMGRQQVMKVQFISAEGGSIQLQLYLLPE